jgi:hypothetical protein
MLKKYLIERNVPGVGSAQAEEYEKMTGTSNDVLKNLGPDIQWKESFVTDDKIYCVYLATDENIIREHAKLGGFPADKISEIKTVLDPTTVTQAEVSTGKVNEFRENRLS